MAKNSQMRKLLLCGGILLVVLFFLGVFKMKEGFYSKPCSSRNSNGCDDGTGCSWNSSTNKCSLNAPCSQLSQPVCAANTDVCKWTGTRKEGSCGNK